MNAYLFIYFRRRYRDSLRIIAYIIVSLLISLALLTYFSESVSYPLIYILTFGNWQ